MRNAIMLCALAVLAGCTQDAVDYDEDAEVYRSEVCFVYRHTKRVAPMRMYVPCPHEKEEPPK